MLKIQTITQPHTHTKINLLKKPIKFNIKIKHKTHVFFLPNKKYSLLFLTKKSKL